MEIAVALERERASERARRGARRPMAARVSARHVMVWLLVAAAAATTSFSCARAGSVRRSPATRQRLEVQRHLKRLNKQAVKSIKVAPFSLLS